MHFTLPLALIASIAPFVAGHGFIKSTTVEGKTSTAQKTDIKQSSFRAVPDNTGWIGSNFFSSKCIVCGCQTTPFNTVAAPGGTNFADASQSAGQSPSVPAGNSVQLLVAGNPGQGWPHPNGHLQVYMASCGGSCTNFDASTGNFFKVASVPNGVPALRSAYDSGRDGNPWAVTIPKEVASGSYIVRYEILAYGQSSQAEGGQVQLYPFCQQLTVTGGGSANPATVKFPDVYANDKDIAGKGISYVPGPAINAAFGGTGTGTGSASSNSTSPASSSSSSASGSSSSGSSSSGSSSSSSGTAQKQTTGKKCKTSSSRKRSHRRHHDRAGLSGNSHMA